MPTAVDMEIYRLLVELIEEGLTRDQAADRLHREVDEALDWYEHKDEE